MPPLTHDEKGKAPPQNEDNFAPLGQLVSAITNDVSKGNIAADTMRDQFQKKKDENEALYEGRYAEKQWWM